MFAGADKPLSRAHNHAHWFHGKDGLGDRGYPAPKRKAEREGAVDAILGLARAEPGLTLVTEEALGWLSRAVGLFVAATVALDLATAPRHGGAGLVAVFVAIAVGWIMLPLLVGSDRALVVARLAVLPLTRRDLVVGLFAASLVGAPPLATLVLLS